MDHQEIEWVEQAKAGDTGAFDRLIRRSERRVLHAIGGILGFGPDVYDAYQDCLVKAFTSLSSFRNESSFSTWLTRIAINGALNERRRRKPERNQPLEAARGLASPDSSGASASLETDELRRATNAAVETLSDRERAVFMLKHQHGHTLREIGGMLGCAEGTVKNYLFRATQKLRVRLEPEYRALG